MIIEFFGQNTQLRLAKLRSGVRGAVEALPLPVFLAYVQAVKPGSTDEWRGPYFASATLAISISAFLLLKGRTLNRIYLGLTLYFISGSIALLGQWARINTLYGEWEATAMLAWIVGVGIVSTLTTESGFVGMESGERKKTRRRSWYLVVIAAAMTLLSGSQQRNAWLSAYLPFIVLIASHAWLRAKSRSQ